MSVDPLASPPPARRRLHLRSDDLEEVRAWTARDSGRHSRVVHGRGPLGFEMTVERGTAVDAGRTRIALAQCLRGSTPRMCLHVPHSGFSRYTFGRETFELRPGAAIVVPRNWEHTRRSEPHAITSLAVNDAIWKREVRARHPDLDPDDPLHPRVLDLGDGQDAALKAASDVLLDILADPGAPGARLDLAEAAFIDALADALWRASAWTRLPQIAARRMADLESWIDAHLDRPITLGRLCKVSGVGARSLQQAFQARRGMSPIRFVTERRLQAVHEQLTRRDRMLSVSAVALECGFAHLGRFGALYREAYGESPSQTMRRRG